MENDATDPEVVRALLKVWKPNRKQTIWDSACGTGALARQLKQAGYAVVASDIADISYGDSSIDFLKAKHRAGNVLVVHPPGDLALDFLRHAIRLGITEMAMVMPRRLWEPRHIIFNRLQPAIVMPFSDTEMWVVWYPGSGRTKELPLPGTP